ncbi:MAG TPA: CYCXC family (seleno)protein [Terriglobia bacterium]|nr:CYCXC family (seleno)protein [Terriglobia bacterium]
MKSTNKQNLILGILAVAIIAGIAWFSLRNTSEQPAEQESSASILSMAADVLSPSLFADEKTRAAYQTAKDIPEVLEQLPCFCGCLSRFGHKNNLFCFKDQHGSGCDICQDIALDARKMHDQGMSIPQIQEKIKAKYSRYQE